MNTPPGRSTLLRAGALLTLLASSCDSSSTALLQVTADGPVDQFFLYVRDDDATPKKILVKSGWTDATKMGALAFGKDSHTIGVNLPRKGHYTIVLFGMKGTVPCLLGTGGSDASVSDDAGQPAGDGLQFFWANAGLFDGHEEIPAHLYLVQREGSKEDGDCDGFPDVNTWLARVHPDPAIATTLLDCDDGNPERNPLAVPRCGEPVDLDCSGVILPACVDTDGDGDPDETDCAPNDPKIHHSNDKDPFPQAPNCCGYSFGKTGPDALKSFADSPLCHPGTCGKGVAFDCTGPIACKADQDCDTFTASDKMQNGCSAPANTPPGQDCNDCDPKIHPGAREICGDSIDNNCNGQVDEGCIACDLDGDGFQRKDEANGCPDQAYPQDKPLDCDDENRGVYPGYPKDSVVSSSKLAVPLPGLVKLGLKPVCDMSDPVALAACALRRYCRPAKKSAVDCDGSTLAPIAGCPSESCDADGDGFIDAAKAMACDPSHTFTGNYDCNDNDPTIFPNAPDKCGDGIVQNCKMDVDCGSIIDVDKDHYSSDFDSDDSDPAVHPFALEVCNGVDDNSDGLIDEDNPDFTTGKSMGTAVGGPGTSCNTSGIGACKPAVGHCVCSGIFLDPDSVYVTGEPEDRDRLRCPDDGTADPARKQLTLPRCYFAIQPRAETCDGIDTSCSRFDDIAPADHKTVAMTQGLDTVKKSYQLTDCPGPLLASVCCPPPGGMGLPGCKTPETDALNCGNCNQVCSTRNGTPMCAAGACKIACKPGFANCNDMVGNSGVDSDGCEINTLTDAKNCGAGGGSDSKAPGCGVACSANNVAAARCEGGVCDSVCANSFADCDENKQTNGCEKQVDADPDNCGVGGAGGPLEPNGKGPQGAGCGVACSNGNVVNRTCANGICNGACANNFADCDGNKLTNGCERRVDTDADNCGVGGATGPMEMNGQGQQGAGCGVACSNGNIASRTCAAGICNGSCASSFADCDGNKLGNGCEKRVDNDPDNCGAGGATGPMEMNGQGQQGAGCGVICSSSHVLSRTCAAGVCNGTCNAGFADCNANKQTDGCEASVASDPNNCGAGGGVGQGMAAGCGVKCSNAHIANPTCANGVCNGTCDAGFADCNSNKQTDGCETSTFSAANCGAGGMANGGCGCACSSSQGTPACGAGACTIACNGGFANCDNVVGNSCAMNQANGCEVSTFTDPNHCGAGGGSDSNAPGCNSSCSSSNIASRTCGNGVCNGACSAGFADCDGNKLSNGCERTVSADPDNCGAGGATGPMEMNGQGQQGAGCGIVCSNSNMASRTCAAGICNGNCSVGFADCDVNKQTNGCEKNVAGDADNCGAGGGVGQGMAAGCGVVCSNSNMATRTCSAGACNGTCNNGFADCDTNKQTNGCEANTFSVSNCGPGGATNGGRGAAAGCGCACSSQNGTPSCGAGACTILCTGGFANCDNVAGSSCGGNQNNGCEVSTSTDPNNCGAGGGTDSAAPGCGVVCSSSNMATRTCAGGVCSGTCSNGFADCDNDKLGNGCEVNTFTITSCGPGGATNNGHGAAAGCGCICSSQNGTPGCGAGACTIACNAGFGNCDNTAGNSCSGNQNNGCETNILDGDIANCGACGTACSQQNYVPSCVGGACTGACNGGFADCNANLRADGCECDLATSQCSGAACLKKLGQACGGDGQCLSGACCGVCVDKTSDTSNCGACGNACGVRGNACVGGACQCDGAAFCAVGQHCVPGTGCVCDGVGCPTGCCNGTTCVTVTTTALCGTGGAACANCNSGGTFADTCSMGACKCGVNNACSAGQACSGGNCVCNAATCPSGCCQGNVCQPGNQAGACGSGGAACASCVASSNGHACVIVSGNNVCGCGTAGDCPALNACNLSTKVCSAACTNTNVCNGGCCKAGTCRLGTMDQHACGIDGNACVDCGGGGMCSAGTCI